MDTVIKRDFYLDKLIRCKHNGLVKTITGIRRCGKSYLLNNLFYDHLRSEGVADDHIVRFSFDSASDLNRIGESLIDLESEDRKVDPNKFLDYIDSRISDRGDYYLLLDEVQMLGCFESVLNGYLRERKIDLYVTGSNAKFLSKDVITEFAGRGDEIHMMPLSFSEFMSVYKGNRYDGLMQYMLYGGIPLVVLRDNDEQRAVTLNSLFKEIYIRDIISRNKVRNHGEFEDILDIISSSIGSLTNPEKLRNTFHSLKKSEISSRTVKRYLQYLEDSFIVQSASRYDVRGKKYIAALQKYYFSDLGLRNARINFRQFEISHCMENVIFNELVMRGYNVDVGVVPVVEKIGETRERKQLEIDFVCNQGSERIYIQSAYSVQDPDKRKQEMRPFGKTRDSFRKVLITNDMVPSHYTDEGIFVINIYDFLLEPDKLK